jgi:hypothetical protein
MRHTKSYLDTVHMDDPVAVATIDQYRQAIRRSNQYFKKIGDPTRHFLRLHPRLGKNNPHAHFYAVGGPLHRYCAMDIKLEHASRVDLYVGTRSNYR